MSKAGWSGWTLPSLTQRATWVALFKVILPEIMPGVITGGLLAFTMSLDDFVISFFVYGAGEGTLPIKIYSSVKVGVSPQVNALCTLIMGVVFIAVALSRYLSSVRCRAPAENGTSGPRRVKKRRMSIACSALRPA